MSVDWEFVISLSLMEEINTVQQPTHIQCSGLDLLFSGFPIN